MRTSFGVERLDLQHAQSFTERVFVDERADLTDHQGGEARVDVLSQAGLQRGETLLLKPRGDGPCPRLRGPLEQGRPAPECQRFAVPPRQVLEPERVNGPSRDVEAVTSVTVEIPGSPSCRRRSRT